MHSEPDFAPGAAVRGRRRKRGTAPAAGPVFVDNSGRRARLLRRLGLLMGAVCVGYAAVLGLAFMGIGTSVNPSSLLPFADGGGQGGPGPGGGGARPQGGVAPTDTPPSPAGPARPNTSALPATASSPAPSASVSASTATD
ncbi:hypothetical protein ACF07W_05860 [Streptomyces sp. NPDC015140]|uniref:hypothetical protein n=1 Tax=Streptomyces sp. NPDC015140 TaxID=3364943 RepID=UPI003700C5B3